MAKTDTEQKVKEEIDVFDSAILENPITPIDDVPYVRSGKHWDYYISLKGNWRKWWTEFSTELNADGRLKYRTAWSFCRTKTKIEWQRELLWEMIGPKPAGVSGRTALRVPWLGDWLERRKTGFMNFEDKRKLQAIQRAYKEQESKLSAVRGLSPLNIQQIARWEKLAQRIDEAFADQPISPRESPTSEGNKARLELYVSMQKRVLDIQVNLWHEWIRINGLDPNDPTHWLTLQAIDATGRMLPAASGPVVLEGQLVQPTDKGSVLPENVSIDDLLLAKMLRNKAQTYKMNLPGDLDTMVGETTKEDIEKAKKKVH